MRVTATWHQALERISSVGAVMALAKSMRQASVPIQTMIEVLSEPSKRSIP